MKDRILEDVTKSYKALNYEKKITELQLLQQQLIPNIDTGYHQVRDWNSLSIGVVILTVLPIPFISEIPATKLLLKLKALLSD